MLNNKATHINDCLRSLNFIRADEPIYNELRDIFNNAMQIICGEIEYRFYNPIIFHKKYR